MPLNEKQLNAQLSRFRDERKTVFAWLIDCKVRGVGPSLIDLSEYSRWEINKTIKIMNRLQREGWIAKTPHRNCSWHRTERKESA